MTNPDIRWTDELRIAVDYGYLEAHGSREPRRYNPKVVLNDAESSMLHALRAEIARSSRFLFSVAFISTRAIALLKQELVDFDGNGTIVTADYLGFNRPEAFTELFALRDLGIDVRRHESRAFHPKGYIFGDGHSITTIVGSSNLTHDALVSNHEWNLKVSASPRSDLATQIERLIEDQIAQSASLTAEWIDSYAKNYRPPARPPSAPAGGVLLPSDFIEPNAMQKSALSAIAGVRDHGEQRAIVISATGTGKTILSALDVRSFNPRRLLFVVHREQILDRTIEEFQRVLGGSPLEYGKLSGGTRQTGCRYLFATVQTLSQPDVLQSFDPSTFDYMIVDEAHRSAAPTYQKLLEYFHPSFLLGLTATPERTDRFNVFEIFDYNVPYEIRLGDALEQDMLAPFHYYGVADVTFEDGSVLDETADLRHLISRERVDHVVRSIEIYGQAAVSPKGLIFCSRIAEARELSAALNQRQLRGHVLRTRALSGEDPVATRNDAVRALDRGDLDYILTVDIFNEGVDIPAINQVIMLRQTQSAIVFVQQLGRGLRKAAGKEYLVVIDFIGNYSNNFLIPVALFGDESLSRESLRQNLISAEEVGVLPGLSSVRFDKIAQERVLRSIAETKLDSMPRLKAALEAMRNRVGRVPALWDFLRFESTDPVLLATKRHHYPELVRRLLKVDHGFTDSQSRMLWILSHEGFVAKRPHDLALLRAMLRGPSTAAAVRDTLRAEGIATSVAQVESAIDTFTLERHAQADRQKYGPGILERRGDGSVALAAVFMASYLRSDTFAAAVDDLIRTGLGVVTERYDIDRRFTPGRQYSRKETCRLLNWPRAWTSVLYGYKVDLDSMACPIFVTLHKSADISASTAYEDSLLDPSTMRWYSRSRQSLQSPDVRAIVSGELDLPVFIKKDDAEGSDFYYLGQATPSAPEQIVMPTTGLDIVRMLLHFDRPIDAALFDYFRPEITELG